METRKIQKVGSGTYTVSLPKEWAKSMDIAAGSVVNLQAYLDGSLVIQVQECETDSSGEVPVSVPRRDPGYLEQTLRAAYAAGTAEVTLEAADPFTSEQRRVVRRVTRNLPGVTVVEEAETQIIVRTLLDAAEVSITQSVRQLQYVALSMHRDATAVLTGDATPDGQTDRDDQADRIYAMIDRHVARGLSRLDEIEALGLTRSELFELWVTTSELERVADHAAIIQTSATEMDHRVSESTTEEFRSIARTARSVVEDAVSVIVGDADIGTARRALTARDQVRDAIESLERRLFESPDADYRLICALDSVERTAEHGGNIAELGLRAAFRRGELSETAVDVGERNQSKRASQTATDTKR